MKSPFVMNRRAFSAGLGALALAPLAPRLARAASTAMLGEFEVTVLSDGQLNLPLDFAYPDVPREELVALLEAAGQRADMLVPDCNVTVLKSADRLVLFDVGSGANFMPTAGLLPQSLADAGIDPADVTDVIFTHAHPDHLWGLLDEFDEVLFPDADYHMNQVEWDYWRADGTLEATPEERKSFVVGAQSRLAVLEDRINLFAFGAEVIPGVEAVDTNGHTPGHTSFAVHGGGSSLMVIGDAISNQPVSFEKPDWPSGSDQDPATGAATRAALLDRLVTDDMQVVGYHLPHPGTGRVERSGTAYRYIAA